MCKNSRCAGFFCLVKVYVFSYMLAMLNSHHVLHIALCQITGKLTRTILYLHNHKPTDCRIDIFNKETVCNVRSVHYSVYQVFKVCVFFQNSASNTVCSFKQFLSINAHFTRAIQLCKQYANVTNSSICMKSIILS